MTQKFNKNYLFRIVITTLLIISNSLFAQTNGVGYDNNTIGILKNVFDSYGNKLNLDDIKIDSSPTNNNNGNVKAVNSQLLCSSGIFELYFEKGSGMENTSNPIHNQRRDVLCHVFTDISNFIQTNLTYSNTAKVKIWVRDINNTPDYKNGILSYGSSFYQFPLSNPIIKGGIIDNEVWKTIHTGVDSYANTLTPLMDNDNSNSINATHYYHGAIAFNFNSYNKWNLSLTSPIPSNKLDLYSVVLKEVGHILGIVSLIDKNGDSVFGTQNKYYSRFDSFLKNSSNQSLILNPIGLSSMYDYNYTLSNNYLNLNCTTPYTTNNTVCSTSITYSGSVNIPVYTPNCFESRKSLSHLEDQCVSPYGNDNYFVMSNNILNGITKRYFKPEERAILCDIGYTLNSTYGSANINYYNYGSSCNGNKVAGVNDGLNNTNFTFIGNAETPITINGILNNDVNFSSGFSNSNIANLRFEGLQDVYQNSSTTTIVTSGNDSNATITFTSSVPGIHLLRYVPYDVVTGLRGNITYIYVIVNPINFINNTCGTPTNCNLIINGDFEQYSNLPGYLSQISYACNWQTGGLASSPDYLHSNGSGNVQIPLNIFGNQLPNNNSGNAYAGIYCTDNLFYWGSYREHIATQLAEPLRPNTSYTLKFDVSLADFFDDNPAKLQACFTNLVPGGLYGLGSLLYEFPLSANDILLTNTSYSSNTTGWDTITFSFTTGNIAGQKYLYLGGLSNVDFLFPTDLLIHNRNYYYIDNVSLVPNYGNTINLPTNICLNKTINNLAQYIVTAPIGGVFTGAGVSEAGGIYSFNATSAGVGIHTITYTFNDSIGCPPIIVNAIIEVKDCAEPYISQVFADGNNDKAIEVKNLSNTKTIMPNSYYLVWYEGNGAPANLTTPTAFIDLASNSNIPANGVKVFKSSALANPAYVTATAEPFTTFENYDGVYDVLIISTSNGANAYNDRIDIIGDNTANNVLFKEYTKESYESLVRMSCTPMGFPRVDYDEQDWVGFSDTEVANQVSKTNAVLGRHYSDELRWQFSGWNDLGIIDPLNESNPDRSREIRIFANYNTGTNGSFEACSIFINEATTLTIDAGTNVKVQTSVTLDPNLGRLIVKNEGALVMVRDCYYTPTEGFGCGTELVNLGANSILTAAKQTVSLSGPYDYVYWSSPLSSNTNNPKLNQIFNFGSGTGPLFNPNRLYLFQNDKFCDIYKRFSGILGLTDGYDDNYDDYDPSNTFIEQSAYMIPGRGYNTWPPTPVTPGNYNYSITFSGEMNNGIVTVPVYKNNSISGKNANLVGNPYPSAIDLDKFFTENNTIIEPIAYIWTRVTTPDDPNSSYEGPNGLNYTAANYSVYTQDMSLNTENNSVFAGGKILASGQSFFVRTYKDFNGFANSPVVAEAAPISPATIHPQEEIIPAGNLQFRNYMRTTEPNITFSRIASNKVNQTNKNQITGDKLWVNLTDANSFTAQLGIYFKPTGNMGYLPTEDAVSIAGRKYNFYTQSTTEDLIIDVQETFNTDKVIPLGITNLTGQNQQFTISIPKKGGIFNTQTVYLEDTQLGIVHNLNNSNYSFTTSTAIIEGRFNLRFTAINSNFTSKSIQNQLNITLINNEVVVKSVNQNIQSVYIADIYTPSTNGMIIEKIEKVNSKEVRLNVLEKYRLLAVKVVLEDGSVVTKKILR